MTDRPLPGSDEWFAKFRRERAEARKATSEEFLASGDDIPDIDFSVDCPICDDPLDFDDEFYCAVCNVSWPKSGYGHKATRHRDE